MLDKLIERHQNELDEGNRAVDLITRAAADAGRDLDEREHQQLADITGRMAVATNEINKLREQQSVIERSRATSAEYAADMAIARNPNLAPGAIVYRSAGEYLIDSWRAGLGEPEPRQRIELFHRVAAHQTTADNLGVIPQSVLDPVINDIDAARPLVQVFGAQPAPSGPTFNRPKVTQHTQVGAQTAEKAELPSRKMLITRNPVTLATYGGYVNVSRQDVDWSQPNIMDLVVQDLSDEYAIETEEVLADALQAAAQSNLGGTTLTGAMTQQAIAGHIWHAAALVFAALKNRGQLILATSPDMLELLGPIFAPVNPQNAQSTGFGAGDMGQGAMGQISRVQLVVSSALDTGQAIVTGTRAVEVYEQRGGTLSVVEPSVLGTQVAYYGYFGQWIAHPAAVIKLAAA